MEDNNKEAGPAKQEVQGNRPLNILFVEDDPSVEGLVKAVLEDHNINSFTNAEDAMGALKRAKENGSSFDWVITDKGLAGAMDGFGLADLIRKEKLGTPYVTLLTGSAQTIRDENTTAKLKEKGIDQLVGKPFDISELTDSVNAVREFANQSQNPQT